MNIYLDPSNQQLDDLLKRPLAEFKTIAASVQSILEDVQMNGDKAIIKYNKLFDQFDDTNFLVGEKELSSAKNKISVDLIDAINMAAANITKFHAAQIQDTIEVETMPGIKCYRKNVPIESVGLYIPGGTAPLFSTLLMLAIPAKIAGCKEIIVSTPASANGELAPSILYTAELLGIKKIYKVGGAQAIAAMGYGTESVPKVNKIFGPGNQFVTVAKQLLSSKGIAIDLPAGPSEVAIYADETAEPSFVAADLLSQAEHGVDSQVLLVATNEEMINNVQSAIEQQLEKLPRKLIAATALKNSNVVLIKNPIKAFELLNKYAPEHLIIASSNAVQLSDFVVNAGSVFIGNYAAESLGDYASGTNHTLPTNGYAKAYSGVSLDSFVKKITFQQITETGLSNIGPATITMALQEGLQAHASSIKIRLQKINTTNNVV